ncbi:MAG: hypothetical protein ACRDV3_15565 [Acidothermaceae bacterium]
MALCAGLVVAETLILLRLHAGSALALAPQIAAPAPLGVFHDERWLLVNAGSWPAVIAGGVLLVALRGALTGLMVKWAWPSSEPTPSWRKALLRGWSSTAVAAVLLSPCASLLVAFELAPISDLWLAAIPTALGIALFMHHAPVDSWWAHPRLRSVGWILLSFVELTVAGGLLVAVPRAWTPVVALAAGLADAWAWRGVIRALARPTRLRWAPVSPVGLAAVVGAAVTLVTAASAPSSMASLPPRAPSAQAHGSVVTAQAAQHSPATSKAVLVVSGYGVRWAGLAPSLGDGYTTHEFSYLGTDSKGQPLPYSSAATEKPLPVLLKMFRQQVDALARRSGGHIDIVGESEGSLLATIYLLTTPNPPVDHVVLLSPLVRPAGASYPPPSKDGAGIAAGWELRGIASATNSLTPMHVSADSPFISSLGAHANALRHVFGCPVAGVQQFAILPMADAVGIPPGSLSVVPHETVVALHGTLLVNPAVRYDIAQYLNGSAASTTHDNGLATLASAGAAAWQAPPRELRTAPPTSIACSESTAALRSWLG